MCVPSRDRQASGNAWPGSGIRRARAAVRLPAIGDGRGGDAVETVDAARERVQGDKAFHRDEGCILYARTSGERGAIQRSVRATADCDIYRGEKRGVRDE